MNDVTERPVLEGWFGQDEGGAHLIGSRCTACGDQETGCGGKRSASTKSSSR